MTITDKTDKMVADIDANNHKREEFDNILERRSMDDNDAISLPTKPNEVVWFRKDGDKEKGIRASCASFIKQEGNVLVVSPMSPAPRWVEKFVCRDGYVRMSTSRMLPSPEVEKQRDAVKEFNDNKDLEKAVEIGAQGMSPAW